MEAAQKLLRFAEAQRLPVSGETSTREFLRKAFRELSEFYADESAQLVAPGQQSWPEPPFHN